MRLLRLLPALAIGATAVVGAPAANACEIGSGYCTAGNLRCTVKGVDAALGVWVIQAGATYFWTGSAGGSVDTVCEFRYPDSSPSSYVNLDSQTNPGNVGSLGPSPFVYHFGSSGNWYLCTRYYVHTGTGTVTYNLGCDNLPVPPV